MEGKRPGTLLLVLDGLLPQPRYHCVTLASPVPSPPFGGTHPDCGISFWLHHCPRGPKSGALWELAQKWGTRASGQLLPTLSSHQYKVHTTDTFRSDLQVWREGQERKSQVTTIARETFPEQAGRTTWEDGVAERFCWTPQ